MHRQTLTVGSKTTGRSISFAVDSEKSSVRIDQTNHAKHMYTTEITTIGRKRNKIGGKNLYFFSILKG